MIKNNSISKGVFHNEAKIALVSPLVKKIPGKNSVLNYRPVSKLPTFSKIFGKIITNSLMKRNFYALKYIRLRIV